MLEKNHILPLLWISFASVAQAQNILIVDDDGGPDADFVRVDNATQAAAPGDIILVKDGNYEGGVLVDRPLTLIAETGATATIPTLLIRNVPDGEIIISGITVAPTLGVTVEVFNVGASVFFQDCNLFGGVGVTHVGGGQGITVNDAAGVTLVNSRVLGGIDVLNEPATAMTSSNSTVVLFDTEILGAPGNPAMLFVGAGEGGIGYASNGSLTFVQGSTIVGGQGGDSGAACQGGDGGPAVLLVSGAELRSLDSTLQGGAPGDSDPGCMAAPGMDVESDGGTFVPLPGIARTFDSPALLREMEAAAFQFEAPAGEMIIVGFDLAPILPLFLGGQPTPLLIRVPPPPFRLPLGAMPPAGTLTIPFTAGVLGAGQNSAAVQMQLASLTGSGFALGNPRHTVLIPASTP